MQVYKGTRIYLVGLFVATLLVLSYVQDILIKKDLLNHSHIQDIYDRLARNSGQMDVPPLIIMNSPQINAWTDGVNVTITTGILKVLENDDQVAMILGHEIAHAINHDMTREDDEIVPTDVEAHADKMGAFIMMRAGFNECKGKEVFRVFKRLHGDTSHPTSHPSFAYRLDQLDLPQCHIL